MYFFLLFSYFIFFSLSSSTLERFSYPQRPSEQAVVTAVFFSPSPVRLFLWRLGFIIVTFHVFSLVDFHRFFFTHALALSATRKHFFTQ